MDIVRKLKDLLSRSGLSDEEIQFYVKLLKNPNVTVYDISKKAKIPKDKGYTICDSLRDKRLVEIEKVDGLNRLRVLPVNSYVERLRSNSRSMFRTADALSEISPFLSTYGIAKGDDQMDVFSDEYAVEKFVDFSCLKGGCVLFYGEYDSILERMGHDADREFLKNRLRSGRKCYPVIANPCKYTIDNIVANDRHELRKTKTFSNDNVSNHFVVMQKEGGVVGVFTRKDDGSLSGSIIRSETVFDLHNGIYKYFDSISKEAVSRKTEE